MKILGFRNCSIEQIKKYVEESFSIAQVLKKMRLKCTGGNYTYFHKVIRENNIDISHFTGKLWCKGKHTDTYSRPIEDYLNNEAPISSTKLRRKLLNNGIKINKCELCGITSWNDAPLVMHLHHKDGNHFNNNLDNLQILCPNCHSQTDTYSGKKNKEQDIESKKKAKSKKKIKKEVFVRGASHLGVNRRVERPETFDLFKKELNDLGNNYCAMGRKYGVSDNAIRKWERVYKKYEKIS